MDKTTEDHIRASSLLQRCTNDANGCLLWTGSLNGSGYPKTSYKSRSIAAHRLIYELLVGPIPTGYDVHHVCSNKFCLNVEHLQALDPKAHREIPKEKGRSPAVLAGLEKARQVHKQNADKRLTCRKGHLRSEENTYWYRGQKYCRACHASNTNRYYHEGRYRALTSAPESATIEDEIGHDQTVSVTA